MGITSSSLKEFETFKNELNNKTTQVEQNLNDYKNQVNQVIDTTLGGAQALGEAAFEGVKLAMQDLENKSLSLQEFLKKAAESKSEVTYESSKEAENLNYGNGGR